MAASRVTIAAAGAVGAIWQLLVLMFVLGWFVVAAPGGGRDDPPAVDAGRRARPGHVGPAGGDVGGERPVDGLRRDRRRRDRRPRGVLRRGAIRVAVSSRVGYRRRGGSCGGCGADRVPAADEPSRQPTGGRRRPRAPSDAASIARRSSDPGHRMRRSSAIGRTTPASDAAANPDRERFAGRAAPERSQARPVRATGPCAVVIRPAAARPDVRPDCRRGPLDRPGGPTSARAIDRSPPKDRKEPAR